MPDTSNTELCSCWQFIIHEINSLRCKLKTFPVTSSLIMSSLYFSIVHGTQKLSMLQTLSQLRLAYLPLSARLINVFTTCSWCRLSHVKAYVCVINGHLQMCMYYALVWMIDGLPDSMKHQSEMLMGTMTTATSFNNATTASNGVYIPSCHDLSDPQTHNLWPDPLCLLSCRAL